MKKTLITLILAALVVVPSSAQNLLIDSKTVTFGPATSIGSADSAFITAAFQSKATSVDQMKLATDVDFLQRLQYNLVTQARVVLSETGVGATHAKRAAYAINVINSPENYARVAAVMVSGGVNLVGTVTIDGTGKATSSVTDAALLSQVATYWNALAGIDSGS
jgi:hypothetical protein